MDDHDPIADLLDGWKAVRPDLEFEPMALFARCNRFVTVSMRKLEATLAEHGLTVGDFDVLSALRHAGEPFTLRPSELADRVMVTRAGMTGRVDRLETRGFVERIRDPEDRRSEPAALTEAGRQLVDAALGAVLDTETQLFSGLSEAEQHQLNTLLGRLL